MIVLLQITAPQASADCAAPTLSNLVWNGDTQSGQGVVTFDYTFPPVPSSGYYNTIDCCFVDGGTSYFRQYGPSAGGSGTLSIPFNVSCLTDGVHTAKVRLTACANTTSRAEGTVAVPVTNVAELDNATAVVDGSGWLALNADYRFSNNGTSTTSRAIRQSYDDNRGVLTSYVGYSGHWSGTMNAGCWTNGLHTVYMKAYSCAKINDPMFSDLEPRDVLIDHHPIFNKAEVVLPASPTAVNVRVGFRFPNSNGTKVIRLAWLPNRVDAGRSIPGQTTTSGGNEEVLFSNIARKAGDEFIRVTLEVCGNDSESRVLRMPRTETECCQAGCGVGSCVGDPIQVTSGNMRYADHDPLPGPESISVSRTYDSSNDTTGVFGRKWFSPFDAWLRTYGSHVVIATGTNGRAVFELKNGSYVQLWPSDGVAGTLSADGAGGYSFREGGSDLVQNFKDGRLAKMSRLSSSEAIEFLYDTSGLPATVRDADGRWEWTITADSTTGRIAAISIPAQGGTGWTYQYDSSGNLTAAIAPGSATWRTYEYTGGQLSAARDAAGNLIESHTYTSTGEGTSSYGPGGEIANVQYGLAGRSSGETLTRVTTATGAISSYYVRYVGGRPRTVEVEDGCATCGARNAAAVFDVAGRVIRQQNAAGYITQRTYDPNGRVQTERSALRPANCDPATAADFCRLATDALAAASIVPTAATLDTEFIYGDPNWPDRATEVRSASVLVPGATRSQTTVYDAGTGQVLEEQVIGWTGEPATLQARTTTTTLYDGFEPATFAPGGTFDPAWLSLPQPRSRRKSINGPRTDVSDITSFVYYPIAAAVPAVLRGRLAATRNAAGHIIRFEDYDVFGHAIRIVDPNGIVTETTFDLLGRSTGSTLKAIAGCDQTIDPLCGDDISTTKTYSPAAGSLQKEQRPSGGVTVYTYDGRGRVLTLSRGASESSLSERIEYTYHAATGKKSRERTLANENGAWIEKRREDYGYNTLGELVTVTHGDGASIGYTYEIAGRVATTRDENHTTPNTVNVYDSAGRLATVKQKLATAASGWVETSYGYDAHGNLASVTDPNGNVTTYRYDDFGQLLWQDSPVSGTSTYRYDVSGNLVATTGANGASNTRTYDVLGRVTTARAVKGTDEEIVTWTYDTVANGRLSSMSDPSGSTGYTYDRRGLVIRETRNIDGAAYVTGYRYDRDGNRAAVTYPSGDAVTYTYDFAGRPLTAHLGGTPLVSSVTYRPYGPAVQTMFGNGTARVADYDGRYRMLTNTLTGPGGAIAAYAYGYDAAGNIIATTDSMAASYSRAFGYDGLNRLVTADGGAALWGAGSYSYDAMGNLTALTIGSRTLQLQYQGTTPIVTAQTENGTASSVSHDAAGNETVLGTATSTVSPRNLVSGRSGHVYRYDGRGVRVSRTAAGAAAATHSIYGPNLELLSEHDLATGTVYEYIWLNGQPLAQVNATTGSIDYYFPDHLGTPILQTDASGEVTWRVEYEPYGSVYKVREGAGKYQPLRFPGQEANGSDALAYNVFRWYRAGWGRYTQADPIGLQGGLNLYRYAGANPLSNIDPLGLVKWNCSIGYVSYETPGMGAAGATLVAQCESECVKKKRVYATVAGNSGGASAGSPLPGGISYSTNVELNDEFDEPREDALGGLMVIGSIGVGGGWAPLNWSFTYYRLGAANGTSIGMSPLMMSLGIDAYIGASAIVDAHTECCN